jgi:DNA-directed RNA polymerase subunit RPC12/RpoP
MLEKLNAKSNWILVKCLNCKHIFGIAKDKEIKCLYCGNKEIKILESTIAKFLEKV